MAVPWAGPLPKQIANHATKLLNIFILQIQFFFPNIIHSKEEIGNNNRFDSLHHSSQFKNCSIAPPSPQFRTSIEMKNGLQSKTTRIQNL